MMQRTILQTWKHKDLATAPPLFRICQPTWRRYHPAWAQTMFDDRDIDEYVAREFPRLFDTLWQRYARGIERADLIRYLFLFREGGLYADMDFECLRSFEPLVAGSPHDVMLGTLSEPDHPEGIPNALMIARRPGQLFWLVVLDEVQRAVEARETIVRTGPVALGRAVRAYRAGPPRLEDLGVARLVGAAAGSVSDGGVMLMPREAVYPICWIRQRRRRKLFLAGRRFLSHDRVRRLFPRSYAVTYWTHAW